MTTAAPEMTADQRRVAEITAVRLIVGLEVHVELATASKMFTRARNPTHRDADGAGPNTLIDPVVLALPGALPVPNARAIELSMAVGLALGCEIAQVTRFDRKNYFYPDLPKAYQISQYDQPLCAGGLVELPAFNERGEADLHAPRTRVRVTRAHLEEDAGKLMHEAPGGRPIDHSIVDLNRAGTPLLEIVTEPDFTDARQVEAFCRWLRHTVRLMNASHGVLQEGHMRFEPNINCELSLAGGETITTPIAEVKNLNSFRAVVGAIEYEHRAQPQRWRDTGRVMGPGAKATFGWDDANLRTVPQREKEDAHDYRYFPDPDLPPVRITTEMRERATTIARDPWLARLERLTREHQLPLADATVVLDHWFRAKLYDLAHASLVEQGYPSSAAAKTIGNLLTQKLMSLQKNRDSSDEWFGTLTAATLTELAALRLDEAISSNGADTLLEALCESKPDGPVRDLAHRMGLLVVLDTAAIDAWCRAAIEANAQAADEVRAGKAQAIGRLIGHAMQQAKGAGDPKTIRQRLLELLS